MIRQSIETGHHEWEKQNIVTRKYGKSCMTYIDARTAV